MKESGLIEESWDEIADIINAEIRGDDDWYDVSVYRKRYRDFKRAYENVFSKTYGDEYCQDLDEKKEELFKAKQKLYDQRREYNKLLRSDARSEHLIDEMIKVANELNRTCPLINISSDINNSNKEAVLLLSDWHYGMVTDNIWNKYNTDICRRRVSDLIYYTREYLSLNKIDRLHIVMLGDAAHGAIHTTARIKAEEDTCDQIMNVAEIIAETINSFTDVVNEVKVYSCYGNHMRSVQNKKDSIDSDNMEKLIPWWLKQRLASNDKVEIIDSEYKEFTKLNIFGYNICCVHGNFDNIKEIGVLANTIFTKKYGETIDYTISGDKHHLEEFEKLGIENILIRSLCGTDDYANGHRLYSKAGQTLLIFNEDYGREATYHIPLE